ncbi:MAG: sigma-70 family RNA polymerase sigma factor [Thermoleophilia bacterium]
MSPPDPSRLYARCSDEELLVLMEDGDADAFEAVYDRHSRGAYSLAYRLLGNGPAAEDLVQDAFLAVWRGGSRYSPGRGSVRTWILAIVHNRGIDRLRTATAMNRRQEALQLLEVQRGDGPDTAGEGVERVLSARVRAGVGALPEEQQQVLRLAYFGGFTQHEIAEMLSVPLGTVKGRVRLGLERLRRDLGVTGDGE